MKRRFKSLLERAGHTLSKRLAPSSIHLEGHVFAETPTGEVYLGQNMVTQQLRIAVAGLLARPFAGAGVTYLADTGYTATDSVFPAELWVGYGNTPALTTDTLGEFTPFKLAGTPVKYPLKRILFHNNVPGFGVDPIHVAFFFDIPQHEVYDDPVSGDPTSDVMIQEWGMVDQSERLLARKVTSFSKLPDLALTIRWEIRT